MANPVTERLLAFQKEMSLRGIDLYILFASDFHGSEYIGDYFKTREYLTGFTGSAGTAVILRQEAYLWTDGRYFIQAKNQLAGSGIQLQRMGEEGVPTVEDFVREHLKQGGCIGFDGRMVSAKTGEAYQKIAEEKEGRLLIEEDLAGNIWKDRPELSKEPFFLLEEKYTGLGVEAKQNLVRDKLKEEGADAHILTSLYDIAWLFNIRGNDIPHVPVVLSYLVITMEECIWFLQEDVIKEEQKSYLKEHHIQTRSYEEIYSYAASMRADAVLYDDRTVNYRIAAVLPEKVHKVIKDNPTELLKAVKNPVEIANTRKAHIKDGAAFTKFMYWLKTGIQQEEITELSAAEYLLEKRMEQEHFLDVSFDTICAYGEHAAMMHYAATEETNVRLKPEGFLLVDSGGHYLEGTTDITRTIALGPVTKEMRQHYTAVVRANFNLASAKFLHGCRGAKMDMLAREPLWSRGIDYKCGTGHGVGHILNVHEGPNAFRYKLQPDLKDNAVLEEGMITTDEPGVYIEGAYGIRIENELVCKKAEKNEYGQFMCFETITWAPVDLDAFDPEAMNEKEREVLNTYHRKVYDMISPYLTEKERDWLKEYTRAI